MLNTLFGPEVRLMLEENDTAEMTAFLESLHPASVAETLADVGFSVEQVWRFLENTSIRQQALIFQYFPIDSQIKLVEGAGKERMAHLIEKMSHDDRVDLLRRLMPRVAENLLRLVDEADRRDIATLVRQDPNTAGGLMTTDYSWLPPNLTATEALERLRLQAPEKETIYYVYILDDEHRLMGVVTLRQLILAPRHVLIKDIMEAQTVSVKATDDREVVVRELSRYDLIAVPVVDEHNRMVGIITHDDVIDVVVQEATEDVHRMGAVGPMAENYLEANFFRLWRNRAFWLACLFIAELFTFTALSHFEDQIQQVVVLGLFIPLVISTGGNSGSQAATLITRAMALGEVTLKNWLRVLRHELFMGLALGVTLGSIGFIRAALTPDDVRRQAIDWITLALVVSQAVALICVWGTLVGSMLPIMFRRIGVDPGIASSPFVATFVDVTGIMIYFTVANLYVVAAPTGDVAGSVYFEGKLLAEGEIIFHGDAGKRSNGTISADGTFAVKDLPTGKYTITIAGAKGVPAAYGDPKTSVLTIQIAPGAQSVILVLCQTQDRMAGTVDRAVKYVTASSEPPHTHPWIEAICQTSASSAVPAPATIPSSQTPRARSAASSSNAAGVWSMAAATLA